IAGALPGLGAPQSSGAAPQAAVDKFIYLPLVQSSGYAWLQFGFDPQHGSNNSSETRVSAANVARLVRVFQKPLPAYADGAPVYLSSVATFTGTRDLVFVTTVAGHIVALDAHTGTQIWSRVYGANGCHINNGSNTCYTTSSPVIDPNRLYVYSYGLDGAVHKYAVGNGAETLTGGWPETTTLKRYDEKGSSALSMA